ncbi:MAG TPA: hypothetical protein QKA14_00390, partial [Candidatus Megaira endosymbiont of Hartmannula sinica]|nr:hypothetical protein [Candidatus Megaera endosymbiont of Hartmannula sinica]
MEEESEKSIKIILGKENSNINNKEKPLSPHILHTTSTITHPYNSTLPQPSLTPTTPHYLNHHSHL